MGWRPRSPMGHGSYGSWVKSSMGHEGHGSLWVTHSLRWLIQPKMDCLQFFCVISALFAPFPFFPSPYFCPRWSGPLNAARECGGCKLQQFGRQNSQTHLCYQEPIRKRVWWLQIFVLFCWKKMWNLSNCTVRDDLTLAYGLALCTGPSHCMGRQFISPVQLVYPIWWYAL